MLEFKEENMILTGIVEKESKKTGNEYLVANFLDEEGNTFGCMVDFPINKKDFNQPLILSYFLLLTECTYQELP